MRAKRDYRKIATSSLMESVTITSDGVALDVSKPVHLITTNGDEDEDTGTLADGTIPGEVHYIFLVALGHANDDWKITPAHPRTATSVYWRGTKGVGHSVILLWTGSCWDIIGGCGEPFWDAPA